MHIDTYIYIYIYFYRLHIWLVSTPPKTLESESLPDPDLHSLSILLGGTMSDPPQNSSENATFACSFYPPKRCRVSACQLLTPCFAAE